MEWKNAAAEYSLSITDYAYLTLKERDAKALMIKKNLSYCNQCFDDIYIYMGCLDVAMVRKDEEEQEEEEVSSEKCLATIQFFFLQIQVNLQLDEQMDMKMNNNQPFILQENIFGRLSMRLNMKVANIVVENCTWSGRRNV